MITARHNHQRPDQTSVPKLKRPTTAAAAVIVSSSSSAAAVHDHVLVHSNACAQTRLERTLNKLRVEEMRARLQHERRANDLLFFMRQCKQNTGYLNKMLLHQQQKQQKQQQQRQTNARIRASTPITMMLLQPAALVQPKIQLRASTAAVNGRRMRPPPPPPPPVLLPQPPPPTSMSPIHQQQQKRVIKSASMAKLVPSSATSSSSSSSLAEDKLTTSESLVTSSSSSAATATSERKKTTSTEAELYATMSNLEWLRNQASKDRIFTATNNQQNEEKVAVPPKQEFHSKSLNFLFNSSASVFNANNVSKLLRSKQQQRHVTTLLSSSSSSEDDEDNNSNRRRSLRYEQRQLAQQQQPMPIHVSMSRSAIRKRCVEMTNEHTRKSALEITASLRQIQRSIDVKVREFAQALGNSSS